MHPRLTYITIQLIQQIMSINFWYFHLIFGKNIPTKSYDLIKMYKQI